MSSCYATSLARKRIPALTNSQRLCDVTNVIKEKPHYTDGIETTAAFQIAFPRVANVRGEEISI